MLVEKEITTSEVLLERRFKEEGKRVINGRLSKNRKGCLFIAPSCVGYKIIIKKRSRKMEGSFSSTSLYTEN